jgi:hypothetical protein
MGAETIPASPPTNPAKMNEYVNSRLAGKPEALAKRGLSPNPVIALPTQVLLKK